jgi:hypothetical protein
MKDNIEASKIACGDISNVFADMPRRSSRRLNQVAVKVSPVRFLGLQQRDHHDAAVAGIAGHKQFHVSLLKRVQKQRAGLPCSDAAHQPVPAARHPRPTLKVVAIAVNIAKDTRLKRGISTLIDPSLV